MQLLWKLGSFLKIFTMYLCKTKQSYSTYLTNWKNKHIYTLRLALEPSSSNLFKLANSMAKIPQSMAKIAKN